MIICMHVVVINIPRGSSSNVLKVRLFGSEINTTLYSDHTFCDIQSATPYLWTMVVGV